MKMYVGVTDSDWYNLLRKQNCDEVNFWKPGSSNFKALNENEMFLSDVRVFHSGITPYVRSAWADVFCRKALFPF